MIINYNNSNIVIVQLSQTAAISNDKRNSRVKGKGHRPQSIENVGQKMRGGAPFHNGLARKVEKANC